MKIKTFTALMLIFILISIGGGKTFASSFTPVVSSSVSGTFRTPQGICIDEYGYVYVADTNNHKIQKFGPNGEFIASFGGYGLASSGLLNTPIFVYAQNGYLYVQNSKYLSRFTYDGKFDGYISVPGTNSTILGVTGDGTNIYFLHKYSDSNSNYFTQLFKIPAMYNASTTPSLLENNTMDNNLTNTTNGYGLVYFNNKLYAMVGNILITYTVTGGGIQLPSTTTTLSGVTGGIGSLRGIAISTESGINYLYVSDWSKHKVIKYNMSNYASYIQWGTLGAGDSNFTLPFGIAVNGNTLYVVDSGNNSIKKFITSGVTTSSFSLKWGTLGAGLGQFNAPEKIAVSTSGNVYITDNANHRVQKFNSSYTSVSAVGSYGASGNYSFYYLGDITTDENDKVYVFDTAGGSKIKTYSSNLTYIDTYNTTAGAIQYYKGDNDTVGSIYVKNTSIAKINFTTTTPAFAQIKGNVPDKGRTIALDEHGNIFTTNNTTLETYKFDINGTTVSAFGGGTGKVTMGYVTGFAYDNGMLYAAADFTQVRAYNATTGAIDSRVYTTTGAGLIRGIAIKGNELLAVDTLNNKVYRFDKETCEYLGEVGNTSNGPGQLMYPSGASSDGSYIYIADTYNNRIQKFDVAGVPQAQWGSEGAGSGQFASPMATATDGTNVFVADTRNGRIQKFTTAGSVVTWGGTSIESYSFNAPSGVAVDNNYLYVSDTGNNRILVFDKNGVFQTTSFSSITFNAPRGIYVNNGFLYIAETGNNSILKYTTAGSFVWSKSGFSGPYAVTAFGSNIYVADTGNNTIKKLDSSGNVTTTWAGFNLPQGITVDGSGNLYVIDTSNHSVMKKIFVSGITLNSSTLGLLKGQSSVVTPTSITPGTANELTYSYSSQDSNIATVNSAGNVTGIEIGVTNILVKSNDDNITTICTVTVKPNPVIATGGYGSVAVTGVVTGNSLILYNSVNVPVKTKTALVGGVYTFYGIPVGDYYVTTTQSGIESDPSNLVTVLLDNVSPTITAISPINTATSITKNTDLTITFSEEVKKGSGNITIRNSGGTVFQVIDVSSSAVTMDYITVSITHSALLSTSTYYIEIDNGAILDLFNNSFAGISGNGTWSFSTNSAPTISPIDSQTINEDGNITNLPFNITDNETAAGSLVIIAVSDNQSLVPNANISLGGANGNRTISITPVSDAFGTANISISVTDGDSNTTTAIFAVVVNPVNEAPIFVKGSNQTVNEDCGNQTILNWANSISTGPSNESSQTLQFTLTTTNSSLFIVQPFITTDGTLSYTPASNANGIATINIALQDNGGTANGGSDSTTASFIITINAVNDLPVLSNFSKTANQNVVVTFNGNNFASQFSDVEGATLSSIKIESLPQNGVLALSGTPCTTNDSITYANLSNLTFTPDLDWVGNTYFTWNSSDGIGYSITPARVNITIIDTPPTLSNVTISSTSTPTRVGDIIRIDIIADQQLLEFPDITICGNTAIVTNAGDVDARTWSAEDTVTSSDLDAIATFTIDYVNQRGTPGIRVTTTTDASSVTIDKIPTVYIATTVGAITKISPVRVTAHFSESATGITPGGIQVTNGTASNVTGSGIQYSVDITPTTEGAVTVKVITGAAMDATTNQNQESNTITFDYDSIRPTPTLSTLISSPTSNSSIAVSVVFDEGVTGFTSGDISITNATITNFTGSGTTYSFNAIPIAGGIIDVQVVADGVVDMASNGNIASNTLSITYNPPVSSGGGGSSSGGSSSSAGTTPPQIEPPKIIFPAIPPEKELTVENISIYVVPVDLKADETTIKIQGKDLSIEISRKDIFKNADVSKKYEISASIKKTESLSNSQIRGLIESKLTGIKTHADVFQINIERKSEKEIYRIVKTEEYIKIKLNAKAINIDKIKDVKRLVVAKITADGKVIVLGGKFDGKNIEFKTTELGKFAILENKAPYKDINKSYFKEQIEVLAARSVLIDIDSKVQSFEPKREITRGEFSKYIARAIELQPVSYKGKFKDLTEKDPNAEYIQALYDNKLISGYGDNFGPNDKLTREQLTKLTVDMYKFVAGNIEKKAGIQKQFKDAKDISGYAKDKIEEVMQLGLIKGYPDESFKPKESITRQDSAGIIYRLMEGAKIF